MRFIAVAALLTLTTTACATDESAEPTPTTLQSVTTSTTTTTALPTTTPEPPASSAGPERNDAEVSVSGSSATVAYSQLVADRLASSNPRVRITVDGPGTEDGAALLCLGAIPIAGSDRAYTAVERAECDTNGIEIAEFAWAHEAFVLITSASYPPVECLTVNQLYGLFSASAQAVVTHWRDIDAVLTPLGAEPSELPDVPVEIVAGGEDSRDATQHRFFKLLVELIASGATGLDVTDTGLASDVRSDYESSSDPAVIIDRVAADPGAIGLLQLHELRDVGPPSDVRLLELARTAEGECVAPTDESIASGAYPLTRMLRSYVNMGWAAETDAVADFVDQLYLNSDLLSDLGLTPIAPPG